MQPDRRQQRKRIAQDFSNLDDDSALSSTPPPSMPKLVWASRFIKVLCSLRQPHSMKAMGFLDAG